MSVNGYADINGNNHVLSTPTAKLNYPIRGFRFTVEFTGLGVSSFKSCTAFSADVASSEYREGSFGRLTVRKVPGLVTYGDLSLEKGIYQDLALYQYFDKFLEGETVEPVASTVVTVWDNSMKPVAQWEVFHAWPYKYETTGLSADSSEIMVETIGFYNEGFRRVNLNGGGA
ncbi:hypothetical protein FACS189465_2180 [Clostridia bacterium]|nr:hypothetical protein FACS189465_2180 [Clostridia bacterium]